MNTYEGISQGLNLTVFSGQLMQGNMRSPKMLPASRQTELKLIICYAGIKVLIEVIINEGTTMSSKLMDSEVLVISYRSQGGGNSGHVP